MWQWRPSAANEIQSQSGSVTLIECEMSALCSGVNHFWRHLRECVKGNLCCLTAPTLWLVVK